MVSNGMSKSLQDLRDEFDRSFTVPATVSNTDHTPILVVRTPLTTCALRMAELEAVEFCRSLTSLPGLPPGALGMIGFRGRVISAYDLGHFIHPAGEAMRKPQWFAIVRGPEPVALGIADPFHYSIVSQDRFRALPEGFRPVVHGDEAVTLDMERILVLNLKAVITAIRWSDDS